MEEKLLSIVQTVNEYFSSYILVILLVGIGVFYTVRTRFVQVRCFGEGMKRVFGRKKNSNGEGKGGLSSFQALTTAVAAQVGTGNIVGASGAILIGGPGAIFWMWIIAFFGMATIYAEATLAQRTRVVKEDGSILGGPVYYIKRAFAGKFGKFLAIFFSVAAILALGFVGSMVQSNSIAGSVSSITGDGYGWIVGIVITVLAAFIFLGGIKRIGNVTEKMVPFMAILYLLGGLLVIGVHITQLPEAIGAIFKYAFMPQAIIGGGIGYALKEAITQGAKRGLFSNEAGMGSTPHAHAMAEVEKPHDQGVAAMIGVFIDTFVVLTMTALIVIITLYCGDGVLADGYAKGEMMNGLAIAKTNMVQLAFAQTFTILFGASAGPIIGNIFIAVCLFFFALSTIIGWNFFGKLNAEYLFGKRGVIVYSVVALVFIFLGTLVSNDLVWELTDFVNYLMVLPNALALLALSSLVVGKDINKRKVYNAVKFLGCLLALFLLVYAIILFAAYGAVLAGIAILILASCAGVVSILLFRAMKGFPKATEASKRKAR